MQATEHTQRYLIQTQEIALTVDAVAIDGVVRLFRETRDRGGRVFFLGVGGANFTVYSFWIPEQYGTECRASALAFTCNVGRFLGAGITFLVGAGIRHFQTLGVPVALTAFAFVAGILLLPFGEETRGRPLPS